MTIIMILICLILTPGKEANNQSWTGKLDNQSSNTENMSLVHEDYINQGIIENRAPLIDDAKISIECEMDGNYELESFDNFICKILATYADESVLDEQGKIDYRVFKPVLFEFPTYEYFKVGDKVGNCARMN